MFYFERPNGYLSAPFDTQPGIDLDIDPNFDRTTITFLLSKHRILGYLELFCFFMFGILFFSVQFLCCSANLRTAIKNKTLSLGARELFIFYGFGLSICSQFFALVIVLCECFNLRDTLVSKTILSAIT